MSQKRLKFDTKKFFFIILALVILSMLALDYSNLSQFSLDNLVSTFIGLTSPEWAYIYTGTGESLIPLMVETIAIAFYGTIIGSLISIPFILLSSNIIWGQKSFVPKVGRFLLDILRAIPTLIYGLIFVIVVGPGPFAGALALGLQLVGTLAKQVAEAMDAIDSTPIEGLESSGATSFQTFQYAILPQTISPAFTYIMINFEISIRSATTLGLVGAGGIGAPIIFALQARNWSRVSIILLAIIIIVLIFDQLSSFIRKKLA